jgi:predicted metal-dependent phosphoesterase TrpH
MRFELHCHSTCSDGTETPEAVAARAKARGVDVFALTDHDTCAGSAAAGGIRAVEISCDEAGRSIHLLAFARGGGFGALEDKLVDLREARRNRMRVMGAKLAQRGIRIDVEPMIADAERAGRTIGRPDLARAMVAHGAASSVRDAFSRFLYDGGPVDVPHRALTLAGAVELGRAAGAALSLAHPHLYDPALLRTHRGIEGVEAFYGAYDPKERARWIEIADELGLVCTGGSDWHGPEDASFEPGVDLPDDRAERLTSWLGLS